MIVCEICYLDNCSTIVRFEMNYTKGLIRLFIFGVVSAFVLGFFAAKIPDYELFEYKSMLNGVEREIKDKGCHSGVKELFEKGADSGDLVNITTENLYFLTNCAFLRKYSRLLINDETQNEKIKLSDLTDEKIQSDLSRYEQEFALKQGKTRLDSATYYAIDFMFLYALGVVIFLSGRWAVRGFKKDKT